MLMHIESVAGQVGPAGLWIGVEVGRCGFMPQPYEIMRK